MSSVIIDFNSQGPAQQDVEVISRDKETQYIATETFEVRDAGGEKQEQVKVSDPQQAGLLVTPAKMVLAPDSRKLIRYVLLNPPSDQERIYRVVVKPVIEGVSANKQKAALKVLVGYETLVIVRPQNAKAELSAERHGTALTLTNTGNTNILLQSGQQCQQKDKECKSLDVARIYPGKSWSTTLPYDTAPAEYNLWDGINQLQKTF